MNPLEFTISHRLDGALARAGGKATPFGRYELMHFLEGQAELHDGGTSGQTFQSGETIFVPKGAPVGWRSKRHVKKIFAILTPNP